jgi:molybdenum cofactor biosynthesis protein B
MSREQHLAEAGDAPIDVHVLVVSSTRTPKTDESGALLAELVAAAGHRAADRAVVDDDVDAIRAAVRARAEAGVAVVLLTGGTGITGRDVTPEAVLPLLRPRLDGFGELFRMLSFQEVGAAAMMSRACAGLVGRTVVFAMPGSKAACRLAAERLILPELRHLVSLARKERPELPAVVEEVEVPFEPVEPAPEAKRVGGVTLVAEPDASAPAPETEPGWQARIRQWKASLDVEAREPVPESIERLAPVMDVLQRAGRAAVLTMPDGRRFSVWGFPDLLRPSSKVLAVREGGDVCEIVALHRPDAGIVVPGGVTPDGDPQAVAERITGRRPGAPLGPLFAVTTGATYHRAGARIVKWDGHKERDEGTPKQVVASLCLEWSTR